MSTKRPPLDFDAIKIAAHGRWLTTIFPAVGIHFEKQPNKHQPCPMCGGKDRFRCDNKQGKGTWLCSHCGAGDGFQLVSLYTNREGYELMEMIGGILGVSAKSSITPEQRKQWQAEQQAREQAERQEKIAAQDNAAKIAVERFGKAIMHGQSDYVTRKQIMPFEARFEGSLVLIPVVTMVDGVQQLRNLQTIDNTGNKLFLKGGQKKYCYCPIGQAHQFNSPTVVLICEGWATGASIYMAVNQQIPVYVAFDAGNLAPVGEVVRGMYPNARIIFCADNDATTEKSTGKNTGVEAAQDAAKAIGAEVIIPNFDNVNKAVA